MQYKPSPIVVPGTNPEQITRAVWDEFYRISFALEDIDGLGGSPNLDGGVHDTVYGPGQTIDGGGL